MECPKAKYWYKVEMMRALHARGFDSCGQEWVKWCGFIGEQIEVSVGATLEDYLDGRGKVALYTQAGGWDCPLFQQGLAVLVKSVVLAVAKSNPFVQIVII